MTRFSFCGLSNNVRNDQRHFETLTTEWVSPPEVKSWDHVRDGCAFGISMDLNHKQRFAANHAAQPLANETFQLFCDNSCSMNLVPINFTEYLCAGGLGNRQADKKLSLHGALEDRALRSPVIPAGLNRNHDLSALGNVSVLPPSQFNSIMLFFSVAVTDKVYMWNSAVTRIFVSTPN